MSLIPQLTDAGRGLLISALSGSPLNFTKIKIGNGTAPDSPSAGDFWYDTENEILYEYKETWSTSGRSITVGETAPEEPSENDLWYNTTNNTLYYFGEGWATESANITCSTTPPPEAENGDRWYDTANEILYAFGNKWNEEADVVISCAQDAPESPSAGDYWYDQANTQLKVCAALWGVKEGVNLTIADTAPEAAAEGDYWYDSTNNVLMKHNGTEWAADAQVFTYAGAAPEAPTLGDWWYDTTTDSLKEYALGWQDDDHPFTYGNVAPEVPNQGDWWYDTSLHVYGTGWVPDNTTVFTYGSAAPTTPEAGEWWFDTAASILKVYGMLWLNDTEDNFTYSGTAPARAYDGDLWYDTEAAELKEFSTGWMQNEEKPFTYDPVAPLEPNAGDWWYSTAEDVLYEYTGTQWNQNYSTITCSVSQPATQDALVDLVNPMVTIPIESIERGSNYVSLAGSFNNSEVVAGFNWAETGVFAEDADGNELLYAYCHAGELDEFIPANDCGKTIEVSLTILVMVGDAEEVTATIGEGSVYATKKSLEEHKRDFTNPHGVNAEQIGLGNVENVAPADMAITYTISDKLEEPAPGEKMATFMGKVKRAINNLILHLKAENPHSITPKKIKAAEETHQHSTNDITEGILGASRGGTGCASMSALAEQLGSYFGAPVFGVYSGNGGTKRLISLDFTPSAVFLCNGRGMVGDDVDGVCGGLAVGTYGLRTRSCTSSAHETTWSNTHTALLITTNGFYVNYNSSNKIATNKSGETYRYIAFR